MQVRVIRKPEFTLLYHVQIKRWWWPVWKTVAYDGRARCELIAKQLLEHGHPYEVLIQGESK